MLSVIDTNITNDEIAKVISDTYTSLKYGHVPPRFKTKHESVDKLYARLFAYATKLQKSLAYRLFKPLILRAYLKRAPKLLARMLHADKKERRLAAAQIDAKARELLRKKGEDV